MALTVRENILANIKTTLASITVANGYVNTITNVDRWKSIGNDLETMPSIVIAAGSEGCREDSFNLVHCELTVMLSLWYRHPETDATYSDTKLNSLLGDIKKALNVDVTRGGYAQDTQITEIEPFDVEQGQPHVGLLISVRVNYRHRNNDPTTAG